MSKAQLKPSDHSIIKLYTDREHEIYNAGFKDGKIRTRKVFNYVPDIKPIHNENIYPIIIDTVCTWFKIKKSELFSGSRQQYLVLPRSMAINLIRECTLYSFPQISGLTSKDHTSCVYHVQLRLTRKQYWKEDNNHAIYKKLKDLINEKCKEPTKQ
jgi:chromosomal replication initiation ATPase DnaA